MGTAIATLVRTSISHTQPSIEFRDVWGSQKLAQLRDEANRSASPEYKTIHPVAALGLPLADRVHSDAYVNWPRLPELFPTSFSGIKTARDTFLVDINREALVDRVAEYYDPTHSDEIIATRYPIIMKDVPRYNARAIRRELLLYREAELQLACQSDSGYPRERYQRNMTQADTEPYYYRPFDLRWLYYEHNTKLLDERRKDYWDAHQRVPSMISAQANRKTYDPPAVTRSLASYHVIERASLIIPIQFHAQTAPGLSEDVRNLNGEARSASLADANPDDFFFHALATMHTPRYQTENSGALLGDWPRIPLPATTELLAHSAVLGRSLAELLDPESNIELVSEWSFLARLILPAEFAEGTVDRDIRNAARLAVTAGWGRTGQGASVMPRRGDARERAWTPAELERIGVLAVTQSLTLDDALNLLGARCVDIYLNAVSLWTAIPLNVWEYTLGGYQVLKKWLSYREEPLLGRPLHETEARYFGQIVRRITAILLLRQALDASYGVILPGATGLST